MQRNFIVFVVLAVCVIATWYWYVASFSPPPRDDGDAKKLVQDDKKPDKKNDVQPKPEDKKPDDKKKEQELKLGPPPPKAETATLGGEGFHLTVNLTSRGAGVRKVVLNRFEAADWFGKPTDRPLELIQDDEFTPSFRMYHFEDPADKNNPVFGLGEQNWTFESKGKDTIKDRDGNILYDEARFSTNVPGTPVRISKTYRLAPKDYHVTLLLEFQTDKATDFRYQLVGAQGLPIEGEWYTATFRNSIIGVVDKSGGLWRKLEESIRISQRKGGDPFPEQRGEALLQYAGVVNQFFAAMIVVDDKQPKKDDGGVSPEHVLEWARPTLASTDIPGQILDIDWNTRTLVLNGAAVGIRNYTMLPRTFEHARDNLKLDKGDQVTLSFYETPDGRRIATWVRNGISAKPQFDDITVRVNSEKIELTPGNKVAHQFLLYHGPVKAALLGQFGGDKEVPAELVERYTHTLNLRTLTDYHSDNWFGKFSNFIRLTDLIILFTRLMHWLLNLLHYVFGYGLSIVVLTVIVRGAMFPISRKQALFSIKMQELAPELKKIQEKYPNDPQARMQATQEFYRKHGINPLGSCWPIFLQMPIFLGLYFALQESIHFRLAGFLWIDSLAAPDMLMYWSESIPIISVPDHASGFLSVLYLGPYLNILPVFACIFMVIQQIQTMPPPTDEQQAMQHKMLKYMTIFFGIMFYKVAAGLCIYFIASSIWGMCERKLLPKKKTAPGAPDAADTAIGTAAASTAITATPPKWKGKSKKDKDKEKEKDSKTPATTFEKLKALWRDILKAAEKK